MQTDLSSAITIYKSKGNETLHLTTYMNSLSAYIKAKYSSSRLPFM